VFLTEFLEKHVSEIGELLRKEPCVKYFVRLGIDGSVQPFGEFVDLNHGFVNGDAIRAHVNCRL